MTYATYPSLRDRPVLITGGASGIGADLVAEFHGQGAVVAFLDRDETGSAALVERLSVEGRKVVYRLCDLGDVPATLAAYDELADQVGPFEVLVNNAGDDTRHTLADISVAFWDRQISVNLRHQFFLAQRMVARLPATRPGSIINLGSIAWLKGARDIVVYATAKAGVVGLTRAMSREFGRRGVRANAIAPGWVATDKQCERAARETPGAFAAAVQAQAIPEPLLPADVSRLALWLAADDSAHCTGQTIVIDGGVV